MRRPEGQSKMGRNWSGGGVRVGTFIETTQLTVRSLSTVTGNIKIMAEKMLGCVLHHPSPAAETKTTPLPQHD